MLNSPPQALAQPQAEKRKKQFWQFPRVGNWLAGGSVSWKPAGWLRDPQFPTLITVRRRRILLTVISLLFVHLVKSPVRSLALCAACIELSDAQSSIQRDNIYMSMYAGMPPTPPPPSPPPPSPRSLTRSPPPGPGRAAATTHRAHSWLPRALAPPPCPRPFRHSSPSSCSGRGSWPSGTPCATLGRRRRNARSQCASRSDWCCARPGVSEHQPCFRWPVSWNSASYRQSRE